MNNKIDKTYRWGIKDKNRYITVGISLCLRAAKKENNFKTTNLKIVTLIDKFLEKIQVKKTESKRNRNSDSILQLVKQIELVKI